MTARSTAAVLAALPLALSPLTGCAKKADDTPKECVTVATSASDLHAVLTVRRTEMRDAGPNSERTMVIKGHQALKDLGESKGAWRKVECTRFDASGKHSQVGFVKAADLVPAK